MRIAFTKYKCCIYSVLFCDQIHFYYILTALGKYYTFFGKHLKLLLWIYYSEEESYVFHENVFNKVSPIYD